jgi:signal transduction histidine kinase/CheY-like chemotaxis protein
VLSRTVIALVMLGWMSSESSGGWLEEWRPLTTAHDVRNLSAQQARAARLVKLRGVITHIDSSENKFYIQEGSTGLAVTPVSLAHGLSEGDRVEVEGVSSLGQLSPRVSARAVRYLEKGKLPEPIPFTFSMDDSRWLDGQWVQACMMVRKVRIARGSIHLDVYTSQGSGVVLIDGTQWSDQARKLIDTAVVVRGVCVPSCRDRVVVGPPRVLTSELPRPAAGLNETSHDVEPQRRLIEQLLDFSPVPHPGAWRVTIAGVVTATPFPGVVVVQDATGGATLNLDSPRSDITLGSFVEATGIVQIEVRRIGLGRARIKITGRAPLPQPVPIDAANLMAGTHDAMLVRMEGRIESVHSSGGWSSLTLVNGLVRFNAYITGVPDHRLLDGSWIAVSGVPLEVNPDGSAVTGPGLFLPGPDSVTMLEPPPAPESSSSWWSTTRVAYLSMGFVGIGMLGGSWLFVLRVQVKRAARVLHQQYELVKTQFEEKARLEEQLKQAAKLEAIGRLAGGIAHDFNNLLTVINGCAELLADEAPGQDSRVALLTEDIRKAGDRATDLTSQLLMFSRRRQIEVAAVDLDAVVIESVRLLNRVLGENILIRTVLGQNLPPVRGEAGLLNQVIMNLAVNARDAMPHGGTLTLTTSLISDSRGRHVRLTVQDTGAGMSDEVKARIFEPFFTTKESGKGTGLGLSTVYGIIKTVRGEIAVESVLGRGTTFHIDLQIHRSGPETGEPARLSSRASQEDRSAELHGVTLMVVEDNPMVRDMIVKGLAGYSATVLSATSPNEALERLSHPGLQVDVLITDVVMPEMNGRLLAERIKTLQPAALVLFISGYTQDEILHAGILEDQVEFLQKPFTPDQLTATLLRLLQRRTASHTLDRSTRDAVEAEPRA